MKGRKERKELNIQIGGRVRKARETAGLTQEKLSEMIGVSVQYVSDLERGVVGTSVSTLRSICNVLCVSSDYLLAGKTENTDISAVINRLSQLTAEELEIVERGINVILEAIAFRSGK